MDNAGQSLRFRDQLRTDLEYRSAPRRAAWRFGRLGWLRAACFHTRLIWIYVVARRLIRRGVFDLDAYAARSYKFVRVTEDAGGLIEVSGLEHLARTAGPVVIIGNHMSSLETIMLPSLILPFKDVAFVVKEALKRHFIFGPIMCSVKCISVGRANPRDDLKVVLTEGERLLREGVSVVIFPQATRAVEFDVAGFNSLGAKLAARANVPVIPMALKTDFMGNGRLIKDLGPVDPDLRIHYAFGAPLPPTMTGRDVHEAVVAFVAAHLRAWGGTIKEKGDT